MSGHSARKMRRHSPIRWARFGSSPVKPGKTNITFPMNRMEPRPNHPEWTPASSASRRDIFVVSHPKNNVRACLEIARGAAAGDFGCGQGGEGGASPWWAVTTEPTQPTAKRPAAGRVCEQTASLGIFRPAFSPIRGGIVRRSKLDPQVKPGKTKMHCYPLIPSNITLLTQSALAPVPSQGSAASVEVRLKPKMNLWHHQPAGFRPGPLTRRPRCNQEVPSRFGRSNQVKPKASPSQLKNDHLNIRLLHPRQR
jgi:hypothetical protein